MAKQPAKPPKKRPPAKSRPLKKTTKASAATKSPSSRGPRQLKEVPRKRFGLYKTMKHPVRLPSAWSMTRTAVLTIEKDWKLFGGIILLYAVLNLVFVQGLAGTDATNIKSSLSHFESSHLNPFISSLNTFALLIGSTANNSSSTSGPYQLLLVLIVSLALIWSLRQVLTGTAIRIRDSFYRGMYPIVPFVLVLIMICIQLLPFLIGAKLYNTAVTGGIALGALEKILWFVLFIVLTAWSMYMVTSSVFALYIVTLPDMTPMKALRSAKQLVQYRRWTVLRKILWLPLLLLVIGAVIMLPFIYIVPVLAQWVFFLLVMAVPLAIHSYMYTLYRELLHE